MAQFSPLQQWRQVTVRRRKKFGRHKIRYQQISSEPVSKFEIVISKNFIDFDQSSRIIFIIS
jgi:hypothetical protein